jgi:hypothetical protein
MEIGSDLLIELVLIKLQVVSDQESGPIVSQRSNILVQLAKRVEQ